MLDSPNRYTRYGASEGLSYAGRGSEEAIDAQEILPGHRDTHGKDLGEIGVVMTEIATQSEAPFQEDRVVEVVSHTEIDHPREAGSLEVARLTELIYYLEELGVPSESRVTEVRGAS